MPSKVKSASPPALLPDELQDLIHLQSSLLTSVSLHYAHHGVATPINTQNLALSIAQLWGKRVVTTDDIRLCLGVLGGTTQDQSPLYMSDYGSGRICLEISEFQQSKVGVMDRHIDEAALNTLFVGQLEDSWHTWLAVNAPPSLPTTTLPVQKRRTPKDRRRANRTDNIENSPVNGDAPAQAPSIDLFIAQLPRAEITICSSLAKVAPLKEKGRRRLESMRPDPLKPRTLGTATKISKNKSDPKSKSTLGTLLNAAPSSRKMDLLDRILAKQTAAANAPQGLTKAEQDRRAALQRADEILPILSLLATHRCVGQRVSFSMSALVQSLQGSIGRPISTEEAVRCIEVIAEEVAPGYVGIVKVGDLTSVVVNQAAKPRRLQENMAASGGL